MTRILVCTLLLLPALAFSQQPESQGQSSPSPTPPASSPESQASPQATPPPPQDKAGVNSQMQSDIRSVLSSDPVLSGTQVQASVDDVNITLTGTVGTQGQLARVLQLVSPYARYRNVINKVAVK